MWTCHYKFIVFCSLHTTVHTNLYLYYESSPRVSCFVLLRHRGLLRARRQKKSWYQRSLQQEFSFYWLNLSLQEDSCIAKTEPDTSSSAVVIYSLKLQHQNHDALKRVTGQKDTGTPLQHFTLWMRWRGSSDWFRRGEEEKGRWRIP